MCCFSGLDNLRTQLSSLKERCLTTERNTHTSSSDWWICWSVQADQIDGAFHGNICCLHVLLTTPILNHFPLVTNKILTQIRLSRSAAISTNRWFLTPTPNSKAITASADARPNWSALLEFKSNYSNINLDEKTPSDQYHQKCLAHSLLQNQTRKIYEFSQENTTFYHFLHIDNSQST